MKPINLIFDTDAGSDCDDMMALAYLIYAEVLRENTYLSRTIEVQENQKVIDTGLYGIVRHPMYSVTLLLFLSMPLVLGSIFSFFIFLAYPFIIVKRIRAEEKLLEIAAFGHVFDVVEVTPEGEKYLNQK